ncbi:MAG: glycosyltransferase [Hyphomicrobiales bacterium]
MLPPAGGERRPAVGRPVIFVGPLPPPAHGQAVSTSGLADRLAAAGLALAVFNVNGPSGPLGFLRRALRHASALPRILAGPDGALYLSLNANAGMALTALLAAAGRLRRRPVVIHHHTYGHIARPRRLMALLAAAAGSRALHLTICPAMSAALGAAYPAVRRTGALSNVGIVADDLLALQRPVRAGPPVLGHMSNLTETKGIGRVVETFRAARKAGLAARLVVAGPFAEPFARTMVEAAAAEFGPDFDYRGPVYGPGKAQFFADIDVFLFPSLYDNETQGIVNLEALAAGVPVLAHGLCCIPGDVGGSGGLVVPPDADFAEAAGVWLARWNPAGGAAAMARHRFRALLASHAGEVDALVAELAG